MTMRRTRARGSSTAGALALAAALGLAGVPGRAAPPLTAPEVPEAIQVPQGEKPLLVGHASGSQIYTCSEGTDGKWQWTLKAPDAELRDDKGAVVIHHFAGPAWKHSDGSEVTGKAVGRAASPDAEAIPWLLLSAVSHEGSGVLAHVTSIQRINTHGGQPPPAAQCAADKRGAEVRIPYTADYYFYAPVAGAAH
jgi:Protein of unknown function (DUF3455)